MDGTQTGRLSSCYDNVTALASSLDSVYYYFNAFVLLVAGWVTGCPVN